MRGIVVAGMASGVGKTTIACALIAGFARRGHCVQPFKVGPDYIDPSLHTRVAGRASHSLDTVLLPTATIQGLFARAAATSDISIVEGVMGLFDGRNARGEEGSTAQVAKLIGAPVVIVIDVARMARSAGAIALGCVRFDPELKIAGFILNRVASPAHEQIARESVEATTGLPILGAFPRDDAITVPERHLGLVPAAEGSLSKEAIERLAVAAERYLMLDRLWALAESPDSAGPSSFGTGFPVKVVGKRATIAIARDRAFSFYYEDSLSLLESLGAELIPFSPLADAKLPDGAQGVYLGGGFPELFAVELSENQAMHDALTQAARVGLPIYGECGGLMYLGRTLTDFDGRRHAMVGLLPLASAMQRQRVTVGYRAVRAERDTLLMTAGAQAMGHEFHYSQLTAPVAPGTAAYRLVERGNAPEGYAAGNILASYVHLHFGSDPALAARLVAACARCAPIH